LFSISIELNSTFQNSILGSVEFQISLTFLTLLNSNSVIPNLRIKMHLHPNPSKFQPSKLTAQRKREMREGNNTAQRKREMREGNKGKRE
jgi:hypothetical protein